MKQRLRVYVAGAYSADNVLDVLTNMRRGIALSVQVWQEGFAPFCPWLDFQFGLLTEATIEDYYEYSMAWLEASHAVLVQPLGAKASKGTQAEIARAKELEIPVFTDFGKLRAWAKHLPYESFPPFTLSEKWDNSK